MINQVYNERILALAANIPRLGVLESPDAKASAYSRLCGSEVHVCLKLEGNRISDFSHEVQACALGQASSSIMAHNIVGETVDNLFLLRDQAYALLKEEGKPPGGRWKDLEILTPVRDFKARHASTLLTFDAVIKALESLGFSYNQTSILSACKGLDGKEAE